MDARKIMELLRIDVQPYNVRQVETYADMAAASLAAAIGETGSPSSPVEFETLKNQFVVEYVRKFMTGVDNDRILTSLATQAEAAYKGTL